MKKNSSSRSSILLLLLIFFIQSLHAQHIDSLLGELDAKFPQEKIYLQFDKSYYDPGETIWFKAYLTSDNLPSSISKTVYAELLDTKGNILQRKTMPVIRSSAASFFDLPDSLHASLLYVRAYTAWMLNFDSSLLYIKPVHILSATTSKKNPTVTSYSLQFFPEGGDLVTGINSRVAFKATNQSGIPVDVSGHILDENNKQVAAFSSVHDGMGFFFFMPLPGKQYKANWKDKKGITHETKMPEATNKGVVLNINNTGDAVTYSLTRPDNADSAFTFFYVIAQIQQQLVYSARINMSERTKVSASIPADSLADGIMQVTVFNANLVPVAERIVFINHGNYYFITDLHAVEKNLQKRGRIVLQIDVGGNLLSNLSVAVTDADLNPASNNEENIFSSLLLSSDLKGYVYNPAYYFSSDEDSVKQQLDLVMMTNGWRRFKWENLLSGQWPTIRYQPENYLSILGNVFGLSKNLLTGKEVNAILKINNGGYQIFNLPVSKNGEFNTENLFFFDTAKVYYQFNNDKDKSVTSVASFSFRSSFIGPPQQSPALLNSIFLPPAPDSLTLQKNLGLLKLLHEQFIEGQKVKLLETVTVISHQKTEEEKMDDKYTTGFFSGSDAHVFLPEKDMSFNSSLNLLSYLQGKVAGLQISMDGSGNTTITWRGSQPGFFLDEITTDINTVQSLPMSDIAMIKVFPPPFVGGISGSDGGAIAIYTKRGGDNTLIKGLDFSTVIGYSSIRQFYSPDYETTNDSTKNDYRTTLYWNPFVIMDDKTRRITIPFYNNDITKKIKVVIEGMNENGQLTREEKIFE